MPATDPAKQLARELADLRREVRSSSRGSQAAFRSLEVDGSTVTIPEVVRASREAGSTATTALSTANGKNRVIYSMEDPSGDGTTEGDSWFRRDSGGAITGSWRWTAGTWQPYVYGDEVLGSLTVAKLVSGQIAAGVEIYIGNPDGTHTRIDSLGVTAFAEDIVDGIPNEVATFGETSGGRDPLTGAITWNIDSSGRAIFSGADFGSEPTVQGVPLASRLTQIGRGAVRRGEKPTADWETSTEVGVFEVQFDAESDRSYEVYLGGFYVYGYNTDTPEIAVQVRASYDGAAPTLSSPIVHIQTFPRQSGSAWQRVSGTSPFYPPFATGQTTRSVRLLFTLVAVAGTIRAPAGYDAHLIVRDTGPHLAETGTFNFAGASTPPAPPPVQRYTVTIPATWSRSYQGSGALMADVGDALAYQGPDPSGTNGITRSYIGFPDLTSTLTGATVELVELFMAANHWYYYGGGTAVVTAHAELSPPTTWKGSGGTPSHYPDWGRGQGRWVGLGNEGSYWGSGIQNRSIRGVALVAESTDPIYYGRFDGAAQVNKPVLRITYRK